MKNEISGQMQWMTCRILRVVCAQNGMFGHSRRAKIGNLFYATAQILLDEDAAYAAE
ncbi:MAG: hypothetical protein K2N94_04360 [Lachnospiraceae bacterium]|nr:hypothetical protein [Lachnospiraceae bacterium]